MFRFSFLLLILYLLIPSAAFADFSTGQQAYDSGKYKEALTEWQQSAKEGDANSQFQLGKMYEEELGFLQNFVLAHVFYNLAASQGNKLFDVSKKWNI
jgi:TPR repeat protein